MHVANGPLKTILILAVVLVVVVLGGTYFPGPFSAEYEVKTAARIACNEMLRARQEPEAVQRAKDKFVLKAGAASVRLAPEQYLFEMSTVGENYECHFVAKWRSTTEIFLVGYLFSIPPLQLVHHIDMVHKVLRKY